jgi:ribosomal protein L37AE/L43A
MARLVVIVGEMPQTRVGEIRGSPGSFGARLYSQIAVSRSVGFVPSQARQRPCCKTCNDGACVGHCKF